MSDATAVVASYDAASGRCRLRGPGCDETVPAAGVALHAAADPAAVYVGAGLIRLGGAILDALRPADRPAFWDVVRGGRWVDLDRAAFLDTRPPTVAVEHWPAVWRQLLGLNRLVRDLSAGGAILRPEFGWRPDRAQDDHPAYVRDHLGAAGPGITAADFDPAAQVRRVGWDDLAARALADHLRRAHNRGAVGIGRLPPRAAVCLATGLDEPGASRLFGGDLPAGVFRPDALPPALADHLADRALDAVLASGRFDGAAVAAGVGAAAAPGHALYLAFSREVVGFDDDGAWVAGESDAGQEVRTAADRYFRG